MRTLAVGPATLQQQRPTTGSIMAAAPITFVSCSIVFLVPRLDPVQGISMTGINQGRTRPSGLPRLPAEHADAPAHEPGRPRTERGGGRSEWTWTLVND